MKSTINFKEKLNICKYIKNEENLKLKISWKSTQKTYFTYKSSFVMLNRSLGLLGLSSLI